MDLGETFDFATMIYCDYGALSTGDRAVLMNTVYNHLRPGGRFLLDVFTMAKYELFEEAQTWEVFENGGFWSGRPYVEFDGHYKYPGVTLEHAAIVSDQEVRNYYIWNTYFSREGLTREAEAAGFQVCGLLGHFHHFAEPLSCGYARHDGGAFRQDDERHGGGTDDDNSPRTLPHVATS